VTAINAESGQAVTAQTLAVVIPKSAALVAHLFPTSKAFGFVQVGQRVRLRFQAYPYQRFGLYGGTIVETSHSPLQQDELVFMSPKTDRETIFRVVVRLDSESISARGREIALVPGMALEADIEQQQQRLIEWIFDPILSIRRFL
jgi:membrane fusion protein